MRKTRSRHDASSAMKYKVPSISFVFLNYSSTALVPGLTPDHRRGQQETAGSSKGGEDGAPIDAPFSLLVEILERETGGKLQEAQRRSLLR
jgi:hypothetical protein